MAGGAVPEGAPRSGEAEPATKGRQFQGANRGQAATRYRLRSDEKASRGVRQSRHLIVAFGSLLRSRPQSSIYSTAYIEGSDPVRLQKTSCLGAAGKSRETGNGNLFVARRREASGEAVAEPILQAFGVDLKDWHGDESVKTACAHLGKVFTHFSNVAQNTLPETTSPA